MPTQFKTFDQNSSFLRSSPAKNHTETKQPGKTAEMNDRGQSAESKTTLPAGACREELHSSGYSAQRDTVVLAVLVADDHPMVREGLMALINRQPDMRVVAEASNGKEAVEQFFAVHPDVALLDLRMPLMDGVETAIAICERQPEAKLVIVSSYQSEEEVYRCMRAGVQGYVLKDAPVKDLIDCFRAIAAGKPWIPPGIGAKLASRVTGRELTPREMQVLRAMAKGKSNKEIGVILDITESTVKVHVTHLLEKLKSGGRTEAISTALKRGLVALDSAQT
ncbi:MAG TPA: response regulator transcription factor [Candidatus Angelobacter sp.]